jgi:hypothetical protein
MQPEKQNGGPKKIILIHPIQVSPKIKPEGSLGDDISKEQGSGEGPASDHLRKYHDLEILAGVAASQDLIQALPTYQKAKSRKLDSETRRFNLPATVSEGGSSSAGFTTRGSTQADRVSVAIEDVSTSFADGLGPQPLFFAPDFFEQLDLNSGPGGFGVGDLGMAGSAKYQIRRLKRPEISLSLADDSLSIGPRRIFFGTPLQLNTDGLQTYPSQADPSQANASANSSKITWFGLSHAGSENKFLFLDSKAQQSRMTANESESLKTILFDQRTLLNEWKMRSFFMAARQRLNSPGPTQFPFRTSTLSSGYLVSAVAASPQKNWPLQFGMKHAEIDSDSTDVTNARYVSASQKSGGHLLLRLVSGANLFETLAEISYETVGATFFGSQTLSAQRAKVSQRLISKFTRSLQSDMHFGYIADLGDWTGSASLMWLPQPYFADSTAPALKSWIEISRGLRRPALSDLRAKTPDFQANPSLRAEHSHQLEFGVRLANFEIRVYQIMFIDTFKSYLVSPGVISKINSGEQVSRGIDFTYDKKFQQLDLELGLSRLESQNTGSSDPVRGAPRYQISGKVKTLTFPWSAMLAYRNVASRFDIDFATGADIELAPWSSLDFALDWSSSREAPVQIVAGIDNVFDIAKSYRLGFPERGRQIYIGLKAQL